MTNKNPKNVDEYIAAAPTELQTKLKEIRRIIREVAPKAEEKISYGMPYYGYLGRLAYFAYAKNHIGLYITPPIIQEFKKELKDYGTSTATIRFPNDAELPLALIAKILKCRIKMNEKKAWKK